MSVLIKDVYVNNLEWDASAPIVVGFDSIIINWNSVFSVNSANQSSLEIRIGTSKTNWGSNAYSPDVFRVINLKTKATSWKVPNKFFSRGMTYYGQVRITDSFGSISDWKSFSFAINRIPFVSNVSISPSEPSINDDIELSYDVLEDDISVSIKWFKNGVHQSSFNNYKKISKDYLRYKDVWMAHVRPEDDFEFGPNVITQSVTVSKLPPVADELEILPLNPTDQDILQASYVITDPNTNKDLINDKSKIDWYVNGVNVPESANSKSVRLKVKPGDEVWFSLTPSDGLFDNQSMISPTSVIQDVGFRIVGLKVDGILENLSVKSVNPTIEWSVIEPFQRRSRFAKIDIGTAPGSSNVYSTIIETFEKEFVVPDNVLIRGFDYYVTVASSDSTDVFENSLTTHFRINGSLWDRDVSNSTGWTMELSVSVEATGDNYQRLSLSDGSKFAEVRFYSERIDLLLGKSSIISYAINMGLTKNILIIGKNNDIKIYYNNNLIIDGTGYFTESSSERFIEFGSSSDSEAIGFLKKIVYNISGAFDPKIHSDQYSSISMQPYVNFVGQSISDINSFNGDVFVAVNSRNAQESGKIYKVNESKKSILAATENIDESDLTINNISSSPDDNFIYISHSNGSSYFENFALSNFDSDSFFENGFNPSRNLWEKVSSTVGNAISFETQGLVLDTTFSGSSITDSSGYFSTQNIDAIRFALKYEFAVFSFHIEITSDKIFNIYLDSLGEPSDTPFYSTSLYNKTIKQFINELQNDLTTYENYLFSYFVSVEQYNDIENQQASKLVAFGPEHILPEDYLARGSFVVLDPYSPDPYSTVSGGKCFYTHRKPGTPWFDHVNNEIGYSIDFDIAVESVEDNDRPSNIAKEDGVGLYLNDGKYKEIINFLPQEIVVSSINKSFLIDNSTNNKYRICVKDDNMKIYSKTPDSLEYDLLSESKLTDLSSNQSNASRPSVTSDDDGNLYAVWSDDGVNGNKQIYFSQYSTESGWTDPYLLVTDQFGSSSPDISVDSNGTIYVVFESRKSDHTDISVIHKNANGWSEPYVISIGSGKSSNPKSDIDDNNNVHIVWEDSRLGVTEIFYCYRNAANGQWISSSFGKEDIQISKSQIGASRPCILHLNQTVYVSWTSFLSDGGSRINAGYKIIGTANTSNNWNCSGQGGVDFNISGIDSDRADYSCITSDLKGRIIATWHDLVNGTYQIFSKILGSRLDYANEEKQLTNSVVDSKYPKSCLDTSTGNVYIVYERGVSDTFDPYDPYSLSDDVSYSNSDSKIFISRYNNQNQYWESSNQEGGFDVEVSSESKRIYRRPSVIKRSSQNIHIVYEAEKISDHNVTLPHDDTFVQVNHAIINNDSWTSVYDIDSADPYISSDNNVTKSISRKEIRFGDFSNTMSARYVVKRLRYYLNGAYGPFNIRLISSSTANIPNVNVYNSASNNRGDAWLATDLGLFFFNKKNNEVFLLDSSNYGISGVEIYNISFDSNKNMYLATDNGIYVSPDHAYFWKLDNSNLPSVVKFIDSDLFDRIYISSNNGLFIVDMRDLISSIKTTKDNISTERLIEIPDDKIIILNTDNGMPSNIINVSKIDANNVAWIGTNNGLVRFKNNDITIFNMNNGMSSNKINDIAIRNTAIRYLATSAGVDQMSGINIERLDFNNLTSPIAGLEEKHYDSDIPVFNNVKTIKWKDPNILFVGVTNSIYQIEFSDKHFNSNAINVNKFTSRDFSLAEIIPERNDDLQTFKIVGFEDIEIPNNILYEVILNGNKITNGYKFSPSKKILRFDYPLKDSDIVSINIRFDIEIYNNFSQNQAARLSIGNKTTNIEKMLSVGNSVYAMTGGDINTVQINDQIVDLPFDKIIFDATPPVGKIEIGDQVSQTKFKILINKIQNGDEYLPFDSVSGIDKMIVSNFTNFTEDGEIRQTPIPFSTLVNNFDLGRVFDNITKEYTFTGCKGKSIFRWDRLNGSKLMVAGTCSPARIYMFNPVTEQWDMKNEFDDGDLNTSVNFIEQFQGRLIIGTGKTGGTGKIWESVDGITYTLLGSVTGSNAYCAEILNNILYIGSGDAPGENGLGGKLYSYDGVSIKLAFDNISGAIYDLQSAEGEIYAGTGQEGRIYRLDPKNNTQQIVDTNYDKDILSMGFAVVNNKKFVFAGTGSSAQIKRSSLPDGSFTHSFKTINAPVYSMTNINDKLWASIGSTVFVLENVWTSKYVHSEEILDISKGLGDVPWFISDNYIYKIGNTSSVKNVYLKLIDRAGNETKLFTNEAQTEMDANLFDSVTLSELINFTNQNRILEIDKYGNTVSTYDGDDRFYSASKVDEEVGVYFSEIFNGTNNIISWSEMNWDAFIPDNTEIKFYVRSAANRDDLLDAEFVVEINGSDKSYDLSFLTGQYLQFKAVLSSNVRGLSPSLRNVVIKNISSDSTHLFTTNFVLPSRIKSGILTSTKIIPIAADIVFGINTNDSTNFSDYQIIDENRIFTTENKQLGSNLRVGIKFITPNRGESLSDEFGEYGPYNSLLSFNSIEWSNTNQTSSDDIYHYRVTFFEDYSMTNSLFVAYSGDSVSGFSDNGDSFAEQGSVVYSQETRNYSYVPVGETPLRCNTYYYVRVESIDGNSNTSTIFEGRSFIEACGTTYLDDISFNFTNKESSRNYYFRIRFYNDPERTDVYKTVFSGNDNTGWYSENEQISTAGLFISSASTKTILYSANSSDFSPGTTYYLSIDAFDGESFVNNNNSFTFRIRGIDSETYCNPYSNVPVLKNMSIMFELEGNQFVTLKVN